MRKLILSALQYFLAGLGWLLVYEYETSRAIARKCRKAIKRVTRRRQVA